MTEPRSLRVFLVANDGFSAGHVARAVAIARALARQAVPVRCVLATTSSAHVLLDEAAAGCAAVVRLPAPAVARAAGFDDGERRRLVRAAIAGAIDGFAPDLLVLDTFPAGPHGELAGVARGLRRALVRREVIAEDQEVMRHGLDEVGLWIRCADPVHVAAMTPANTVLIPPITVFEPGESVERTAARTALGVPAHGRVVLVAAGGGGDASAHERAARIAAAIARVEPSTTVWRAPGVIGARGPLLQPLLAAFDAAFVPAGYNTAHELAKARVPAVLFAQPRSFDDQAARAARFAAAGLGYALAGDSVDEIAEALAWSRRAAIATVERGGADRAADALIAFARSA